MRKILKDLIKVDKVLAGRLVDSLPIKYFLAPDGIDNRGRGLGPGGRGGRGLGPGGLGLGPSGFCLCPNCGDRVPHDLNVPCTTIFCKKCGTPMVRDVSSVEEQNQIVPEQFVEFLKLQSGDSADKFANDLGYSGRDNFFKDTGNNLLGCWVATGEICSKPPKTAEVKEIDSFLPCSMSKVKTKALVVGKRAYISANDYIKFIGGTKKV